MTKTSAPLRVLLVCTGNICRSPMAEAMLRARVADLDVIVESAGTRAAVGDPMPRRARWAARKQGANRRTLRDHRAQWLTASLVAEADLVVTMNPRQRASVADLVPWQQHVYTAAEIVRIAQTARTAQTARAGTAHDRLAAMLANAPRGDRRGDDIVDPNKGSRRAFRDAAEQLVAPVDAIARLVRAASSDSYS